MSWNLFKMVTTVLFSSAWACIMGIIPTTVTVASNSETPYAAWKAAHDGTFCSS